MILLTRVFNVLPEIGIIFAEYVIAKPDEWKILTAYAEWNIMVIGIGNREVNLPAVVLVIQG